MICLSLSPKESNSNLVLSGGRSGYEYFEEDNYLFAIAQFFPRMCIYNDIEGWQNMQFLGRGEFALTFGDYKVEIGLNRQKGVYNSLQPLI